jgi:hypothetical protein
VTEDQLKQPGTDVIAELALHKAMYLVEGGKRSEYRSIDRLPVLIMAWNRCTQLERARFIEMLREAAGEKIEARREMGRRVARRVRLGRKTTV